MPILGQIHKLTKDPLAAMQKLLKSDFEVVD